MAQRDCKSMSPMQALLRLNCCDWSWQIVAQPSPNSGEKNTTWKKSFWESSKEIMAMTTATNTLQPVLERGWRRGFGNLFRTENNLRWGKNRWILSALIWLAIL